MHFTHNTNELKPALLKIRNVPLNTPYRKHNPASYNPSLGAPHTFSKLAGCYPQSNRWHRKESKKKRRRKKEYASILHSSTLFN